MTNLLTNNVNERDHIQSVSIWRHKQTSRIFSYLTLIKSGGLPTIPPIVPKIDVQQHEFKNGWKVSLDFKFKITHYLIVIQ